MTLSASDADRTGTVRKNRLFGIGVVVAWLLVWQGIAQLELLNPALFPSPGAILLRLYRSLAVTGELCTHVRLTVTRLLGGFVLGALPGLWLGWKMGRNRKTDLRYGLFFATVGLIPMLASWPFHIIAFGVGELHKWFMVAAAVFYPVLYCTRTGVRLQQKRQSADGVPEQNEWQHGAGPWIFTGLKLGSAIGLAALLGGEMYVSRAGLELEIVTAMAIFQFERAFAGMFAVALVQYALWASLTGIERRLAARFKVQGSNVQRF